MKETFELYKNQEVEKIKGKIPVCEATLLAKKTYMIAAELADAHIGEELSKTTQNSYFLQNAIKQVGQGPISQFTKKTIDYQPFDPSMN
ncbi:hypothetical protein KAI32_01075 [Candidatus Pacearchaeota archaeon]|nr:hypothetical protein [Candidatus Pacearchaeota archaeon]